MSAVARARLQLHPPDLGRIATGLGVVGGTLGLAAGLAELAAGPSIRSWVGNKQDTTRLGLATLVLSAIALAAAIALARRPAAAAPRRFALVAGLLLPGMICFTTVGRLWYLPGALLVAAGVLALADLRRDAAVITAAVARKWTTVLTALLGCFYVFLGATELGITGLVGIVGGILVLAAAAGHGRTPRRCRTPFLFVAVAPFAVLTWWSVVTPLIALLAIAIGSPAISRLAAAPRIPRPR